MGWGNKAIEIRSVDTGHLDGVFMHKKAQKLKFLCERNDKVSGNDVVDRSFIRTEGRSFAQVFQSLLKSSCKAEMKQLRAVLASSVHYRPPSVVQNTLLFMCFVNLPCSF